MTSHPTVTLTRDDIDYAIRRFIAYRKGVLASDVTKPKFQIKTKANGAKFLTGAKVSYIL